jgi:hypothetical protein
MESSVFPHLVLNSASRRKQETCPFGLVADYGQALVVSYCLEDASQASIEVLKPDGRRVAAFDGSARARNLALSVNLTKGSYLVLVTGGMSRFVAPLAVAA